ncbi:protein GVQW3-like [Bombyx mori]|uniref:Mos1 transposase HTH domain-containing protein n=1 Tax=Bombyx mori TaxID=7091 RepID=A0A8R2QY24_BOMMO|nr:protein GVQW3-like [Bombyx mori]
MDKIEQRAVIKFLHMEDMKGKDIYDELKNVLGECASSSATVKIWVAEFKRGRTCAQDKVRPGRPKSVTTPEMVVKVHDIVLADRRLKLSEIADTAGISKERVHHILSEELNMKKLSARWVPRWVHTIKKGFGCKTQKNVWTVFRVIRPIFYVNL